ncbi:MAG: hypothetical protein ABFQ82_04760, partial [Thermodesulfobacteriota bacterium]
LSKQAEDQVKQKIKDELRAALDAEKAKLKAKLAEKQPPQNITGKTDPADRRSSEIRKLRSLP